MLNKMSYKDREKLFRIRCDCKQGIHISEEENTFLRKMWKEHPEEYSQMNGEVHKATLPFGARG